MTEFEVSEQEEGGRLDVVVSARSGIGRSEIQRLIREGAVTVDGIPGSKSGRVRQGQKVALREKARNVSATPDAEFEVRFEDDWLAVVSKPAGVVVHPGVGHRSGTLVQVLGRRMPLAPAGGDNRPGVVHRLDKDTSGLLVVAKDDDTHIALVTAMKSRSIVREYVAMVAGSFRMPTGRIDAPIQRSERDPTRMAVSPEGRPAVTEFKVTEELARASLLEVRLQTGRTHQIRVHFAEFGHPVLGDAIYGRTAAGLAGEIGLRRPFLHAARIAFTHPATGEAVDLTEDLPADLERCLGTAREVWS